MPLRRRRTSLGALAAALVGLLGVTATGPADAESGAARPAAPTHAAPEHPAPTPAAARPAAVRPAVPGKAVTYLGHRFVVPASWSVVDLAEQPTACVRFDRHALYLGTPGANQSCPAGLFGHTEALLVQPVTAAAADTGTTDRGIDRLYLATARDIQVTGTYDADKELVRSIIGAAGLPGGPPAAETGPRAPAAAVLPAALPLSATSFNGKGFDACTAPSSAAMSAWNAASPYQAVGVYIGGADRACSQPNLTASWVQAQAADGWHFMPLYVGLQADQITSAAADGAAAADDAVAKAQSLGFGPGAPLYYDMEAYSTAYRGTALTFLSAWTRELHAKGYTSAVYSSSSSGIADLVDAQGTSTVEPDIIFDALWNGVAGTADSSVPGTAWSDHQRVHQYLGNSAESYGGVAITIDRDFLDVSVSGTTATT